MDENPLEMKIKVIEGRLEHYWTRQTGYMERDEANNFAIAGFIIKKLEDDLAALKLTNDLAALKKEKDE